MDFPRIKDIANGAPANEREAQLLADVLLGIVCRTPKPVGYLWRWKSFLDGTSGDWYYSRCKVNHADIEYIPIFDIPDMEIVKEMRGHFEGEPD